MAMKMKAMKAVVEEEVPKKAARKMKAKKAAAKPKKAAARKESSSVLSACILHGTNSEFAKLSIYVHGHPEVPCEARVEAKKNNYYYSNFFGFI